MVRKGNQLSKLEIQPIHTGQFWAKKWNWDWWCIATNGKRSKYPTDVYPMNMDENWVSTFINHSKISSIELSICEYPNTLHFWPENTELGLCSHVFPTQLLKVPNILPVPQLCSSQFQSRGGPAVCRPTRRSWTSRSWDSDLPVKALNIVGKTWFVPRIYGDIRWFRGCFIIISPTSHNDCFMFHPHHIIAPLDSLQIANEGDPRLQFADLGSLGTCISARVLSVFSILSFCKTSVKTWWWRWYFTIVMGPQIPIYGGSRTIVLPITLNYHSSDSSNIHSFSVDW